MYARNRSYAYSQQVTKLTGKKEVEWMHKHASHSHKLGTAVTRIAQAEGLCMLLTINMHRN